MTLTFPLATKFGAGPTLNREFTSYLLQKGKSVNPLGSREPGAYYPRVSCQRFKHRISDMRFCLGFNLV